LQARVAAEAEAAEARAARRAAEDERSAARRAALALAEEKEAAARAQALSPRAHDVEAGDGRRQPTR